MVRLLSLIAGARAVQAGSVQVLGGDMAQAAHAVGKRNANEAIANEIEQLAGSVK